MKPVVKIIFLKKGALALLLFIAGLFYLAGCAPIPPPRPVRITPKTCAECHRKEIATFQKKLVHAPVAQARCLSCHDPHSSDKKGMTHLVTHAPLAQGRCGSCHRLGAERPLTLIRAGASLCYTCYTTQAQAFRKKNTHSPVAQEECLACHQPHASDFPSLLNAKEKKLCLTRHSPIGQRLKGLPYSHPEKVEEGKCTVCHNPHASEETWLLAKPASLSAPTVTSNMPP